MLPEKPASLSSCSPRLFAQAAGMDEHAATTEIGERADAVEPATPCGRLFCGGLGERGGAPGQAHNHDYREAARRYGTNASAGSVRHCRKVDAEHTRILRYLSPGL
jgi:hypothetical protein